MKTSCLIRTVEGRKVKRCSGCKQDRELDAFHKGTGPGGLSRHCRECHKTWRKAHPRSGTKAEKPADLPFDPAEVEVVEITSARLPHWLMPLEDIPEGRGSSPAGALGHGSPHEAAREVNPGGAAPGGAKS